MCKRPWADHPGAAGTAAHDHREASLHQEPAEPPCLRERRTNRTKENIFRATQTGHMQADS